jgi:hypothetical protein
MGKENNAITKAFDLVAATRHKGFLKARFNPLAEDKVTELQGLLTQVLKTEAAKKDISFRETLITASRAIDKYKATPAVFKEPIEESTYDVWNAFEEWSSKIVGYKDVPNRERPRILSKMQKNLYKSLKPQLTK